MAATNLWEKDKRVMKMYSDCVTNFMAQVRAGEEVEWEDACSVEQGKVQMYLNDNIYMYKYENPIIVDEKRARKHTPRLPYFQDF